MNQPDILLLMTDQQRGDCLGCAGHPVLQTPHLDSLAHAGTGFSRAYSECPVCGPARRTLMTGTFPSHHGSLMNDFTDLPLPGPTLAECLGQAGYHTHLCGKLHLFPERKRHGFMSADWADSPKSRAPGQGPLSRFNDYQRFLLEKGCTTPGFSDAHGISSNSPCARPWHADESLHFTNWVTDSALRFLERRDPTSPYFLKVSYLHPHQPCTPPECYYQRYLGIDLPERPVADWARVFDEPPATHLREPWRVCFRPEIQRQFEAAYYGSINHIDDQIGRILSALPRPDNTLILFTSDHGEMLGDHQWIRKRMPWEGSARIPFILCPPRRWKAKAGRVCPTPVQLADVMPTLLAAAGVSIPESVDGLDLRPLVDGGGIPRDIVHGECSDVATLNSGMQYLTDGRKKYIWFPGRGEEQLFDLEEDPHELRNLAEDPASAQELELWRQRLVERLADRSEGFVQGDRLVKLDGPTANRIGIAAGPELPSSG